MPLDTLQVSTQLREMGDVLLERREDDLRRLALARALVGEHVDRWEELAQIAEDASERVAVPTGPLDAVVPQPGWPSSYTALASDGSEIDPDRHGDGGSFYVINIGRAVIHYGQPTRPPVLRSESTLGYRDEDLFIVDPRDARRQVPVRDRHLDARRAVAEMAALADLAEAEQEQGGGVAAVAFVDGTLLFSVLEERPRDFLRDHFYRSYVAQLDRLRAAGVVLAAYASRSRGLDLVSLFRSVCGAIPAACATCGGDRLGPASDGRDGRMFCALRGLTDADLLGHTLAVGHRSPLFRVRSNVHDPYFGEHRVYYFLLNTGHEIARVEVPEWIARDPDLVSLLHGVLVDQLQKGQGYPTVLARADDRAVISTSDRLVLGHLVRQELARRGVHARPSAKLGRKQVRTV